MMLKIEITDDTCNEGEAIHCTVPLDTDKMEIARAIETLFPTATHITMYVEE